MKLVGGVCMSPTALCPFSHSQNANFVENGVLRSALCLRPFPCPAHTAAALAAAAPNATRAAAHAPAPPALGGARPEAQKTNCMALLARSMAARVPLGAYRPNRRSRYPLLDPLNGHKAVELPNQRPVISMVLGHDRSHSKNPGSKRPSTDTQTMSITGLGGRRHSANGVY